VRRALASDSSVGRRADRGDWPFRFVSPPLKVWVAGARPRTLPAAVVPVAVGTAAGYWSSGHLVATCSAAAASCLQLHHQVSWPNALLALVVALGIQVGTNYVNDYADAANCYAVAANAAREARHYDLWACSMVRQAFISLYEREFAEAEPLLDLASQIAARGDSSLSTRQWTGSVHAQALAGLGDATQCLRALDLAESVTDLRGDIHTGGWLRFDGSRLAEERGACLVELGKPAEAEVALTAALRQGLSDRRRVGVLADLAKVGAQLHGPERVATYASAALEVAQRSRSGVNAQRLHSLVPCLNQLSPTAEVKTVRSRIDELKRKVSA